jgi:hypothetical protein
MEKENKKETLTEAYIRHRKQLLNDTYAFKPVLDPTTSRRLKGKWSPR